MRSFWVFMGLSLSVTAFSQDDTNLSNIKVDPADSTGLPGDHFSLQGALEMFKTASNLEDFEKKVNDPANHINNLDLNDDGKVDYVKVMDNMKDKAHAIVLRVPVSDKENQDVAVIEIEKDGDQSASLQIVGDEELYGDSVFVEPVDEEEGQDDIKSGKGPYNFASPTRYVIVNVWGWPCVQYIYAPAYVVWVSPWYWGYWPGWWHPWACHPWRHHWYYGYHHHHYHHHYYRVYYHHHHHIHSWYHPMRVTSPVVHNRYQANHKAYAVRKKSYPPRVHKTAPVKKSYGAPKHNATGGKKGQAPKTGKPPVSKTPTTKSPKTSPPVKKNTGKTPGGGAPKSGGGKSGGGKKGR